MDSSRNTRVISAALNKERSAGYCIICVPIQQSCTPEDAAPRHHVDVVFYNSQPAETRVVMRKHMHQTNKTDQESVDKADSQQVWHVF